MAPAKRRRADTLTGGTGDVNPQFFSHRMVPAVAGTTETVALPSPISRFPTGVAGKSQIVEILKVWFDFPPAPAIAAVGEVVHSVVSNIATRSGGTVINEISNPATIASVALSREGAFTAGGSISGTIYQMPRFVDLTDGAGHGILMATDQFYLQFGGTATWATSMDFRMMYRIKVVGLAEYIGLVQSQQ